MDQLVVSPRLLLSPKRLVAIIGNPNTGKTTLFNRLTGSRQRTGNYPGVTVEKKEGRMMLDGEVISVLDLPGAYSLSAHSADERLAVDALCGRIPGVEAPALVVCVLDAANLRRSLFLPTQIADSGLSMVLALNMYDEVRAGGFHIDCEEISKRLGVPVIPLVARTGEGLDALRAAIADSLKHPRFMTRVTWPAEIGEAISGFRAALNGFGPQAKDTEIHRLLFDCNPKPNPRLAISPCVLSEVIDRSHRLLRDQGIEPFHAEPLFRFGWIEGILDGVSARSSTRCRNFSDTIDNALTGRVSGILIFLTLMFLVFQSIYTFAAPFMDMIDAFFASVSEIAAGMLAQAPTLQSFVTDGVIAGVGGVIIFLPQILILFFFITLLEDTGYMARAAFMMDKVFGWCGLNGKSFVPLLSAYACAVPGVMAARTIEEPKARLCTILTAPLMSCSARLPVYVLFIGAFIEPAYGASVAAVSLFGMHLLGVAVAMPVAFLLTRFVLRAESQPFVLEMPPYRMPRFRDVAWRLFERGKMFLLRAGTVICCMSILIWAFSYFPRDAGVVEAVNANLASEIALERGVSEEAARRIVDTEWAQHRDHRVAAAYLEQSYLGRFGKAIQPVFALAGFDWKMSVAIVASFPAREVVISTLGILYNIGGGNEDSKDLITSLRSAAWPDGSAVFSIPGSLAFMVFFGLCMQCGASLAVIARESSWKWAIFAFCYMTTLAWVFAVVVYQTTSLLL